MKLTLCLALVVGSFGCAAGHATVAATSTHVTTTPRAANWQTQNEERAGSTVLIPATSSIASALREPNEWMCHNMPIIEEGTTSMMVRFTAPMSGAYAVHAMSNVNLDARRAETIEMRNARVDRAGTTVTCYFNVPSNQRVEAVHVVRYELWCPEENRCQYSGIPVDAVPQVEVAGRPVQNGERHSYFGAYLTTHTY